MSLEQQGIDIAFGMHLFNYWLQKDVWASKRAMVRPCLLIERFDRVFEDTLHDRLVDPHQLPIDLRDALVVSIGNATNATWQRGSTNYHVCWDFEWKDRWNIQVNPKKYDDATDFTIVTYGRRVIR